LGDVAYILRYIDTTTAADNAVTQNYASSDGEDVPIAKFENFYGANWTVKEYREIRRATNIHGFQYLKQTIKEDKKSTPLTGEEWSSIVYTKKRILEMLLKVFDLKNLAALREQIDDNILRDLPTSEEVTTLYGDKPRILGLTDQTCEHFQAHSDRAEHYVSTAGTFNSGTNLMAELLIANCRMTDRMKKYGDISIGIRWQVPWGKHSPPGDDAFRHNHKTSKDRDVDDTNILPAVTIRDPYVWMNSLCRIEYGAYWHHDHSQHCPNLIPNEKDLEKYGKYLQKSQPIPVHVKYDGFFRHHESLVGFWNDWYREYWDSTSLPRLMVRYEDLMFHAQEVTEKVCHCAGGSMARDKFTYVIDSAKKGNEAHGPKELRTGYLKALIKYGKRQTNPQLTEDDLTYAEQALDKEMMDFFHYKHPHEVDGKH